LGVAIAVKLSTGDIMISVVREVIGIGSLTMKAKAPIVETGTVYDDIYISVHENNNLSVHLYMYIHIYKYKCM
jgi:hypothetical protein